MVNSMQYHRFEVALKARNREALRPHRQITNHPAVASPLGP